MVTYSSDPGFQAYLQDLTKRHSVTTPDRVLQPVEAEPPQQMSQRDHRADLTNEIARMKGNLGDQESYLMGQLAEMGGWREGAAGRVLQALPVIRAQSGEVTGTGGVGPGKLKAATSGVGPLSGGVNPRQADGPLTSSKGVDKIQKYVSKAASSSYGWSGAEWDALVDLIQRESGWNPHAQNPTSSAYGLFQFLDSTRSNYGISRDSSIEDQIAAGLKYIKDRYGSPSAALAHWLAKKPINGRSVGHWY